MNLTNPPKLNKGDTIGIISPSAGLAPLFPHRIEKGKNMLKQLGFKVVFSKNALKQSGYVSASAQDRADDIHQMFRDKKIKAIICTIGGNHANQVLKYLDFGLIRHKPKIFVGYSDITVLHYAFAKLSKLRTFYGPCLMPEFGEYPQILSYTLEYFQKALMETKPIGKVDPSPKWTDEFLDWFGKKDQKRPRKMFKNSGYEWWQRGSSVGTIFGGTIPTINHLLGSRYWIDLRNKIFFIDIPEGDPGKPFSPPLLDSFLADLYNIEVFKNIKGLIIGRPYCYKDEDIKILKNIIKYYTCDFNYPILYNANIGHASPIITVPMGVRVRLDSEKNEFRILENGVV